MLLTTLRRRRCSSRGATGDHHDASILTAPSALGQEVTFTAKVMAASGSTPTGTVTFKDGTTVLGTGTHQQQRGNPCDLRLERGHAHHRCGIRGRYDAREKSARLEASGAAREHDDLDFVVDSVALWAERDVHGAGRRQRGRTKRNGDVPRRRDGAAQTHAQWWAGDAHTQHAQRWHPSQRHARYNGSVVYATDTSPVVSQGVIRALTTTTLQSSATPRHLGRR
jgi:hypothetical protein